MLQFLSVSILSALAYASTVFAASSAVGCPTSASLSKGITLLLSNLNATITFHRFSGDILIEEKTDDLVSVGGSVRRMSYAGFVPIADLYQNSMVAGVVSLNDTPMPSLPIPSGTYNFTGKMSNRIPTGTVVDFWTDRTEDTSVSIGECQFPVQIVSFIGKEVQTEGGKTFSAKSFAKVFISLELGIPLKYVYYKYNNFTEIVAQFTFKEIISN